MVCLFVSVCVDVCLCLRSRGRVWWEGIFARALVLVLSCVLVLVLVLVRSVEVRGN